MSNYLKIAWRQIIKNKSNSIINISGLAIGIAAFLFILEFVSLEKSVDRFHKNLPDIYRILCENTQGNNWPYVEPGWGDLLKANFPEIKSYCRIAPGVASGIIQNKANQKVNREQGIGFADGNFFDFFTFKLKAGNPEDFNQPYALFLSSSYAKKYFGEEDPMSKALVVSNQFGSVNYTVRGVFEDMGDESDLRYDVLLSFETLKNKANLNGNGWADLDNIDNQFSNMYLLFQKGVQVTDLEKKFSTFRKERQKEKDDIRFRLQAFQDVHLGNPNDRLEHAGNLRYVITLSSIALFILLIAWFNYINLSTAQSLKRANEVGVRKVIGAGKSNLIGLFLTESSLTMMIAILSGVLLTYILQPYFNSLIEKKLALQSILLSNIWVAGFIIIGVGSLSTGLYTAMILSGFKPIQTLKGKILKSNRGVWVRKSAVVFQFAISVALMICTIVVYQQIKFMRTENLGFTIDRMVWIPAPTVNRDSTYKVRRESYQNEIGQLSFVKDFCTSGSLPGKGFNFSNSGITSVRSKPGEENRSYAFAIIGEKYFPVYNIPFIAGRNFTAQETTLEWNDNDKIIINEKAAKALGYEDAKELVNTKIKWDERYLQVIGIVKDYHHEGLQQYIKPMLFYPSQVNDLSIRLTGDHLNEKIEAMGKVYAKYFPDNPYDYFFVDDLFNKQYVQEKQFGRLFTYSSLLAILIACMGLLGLSIYSVKTRTKEIGVRKVLGASVAKITALISKDFIILVMLGILVATPLAYYFMNKWLSDFAYKIEIRWWMFLLAGLIAMGIALFTIGVQSVKAALANPVQSIRTE